MAIQKLEIHGYRSFDKAIWEPGKLNLLVGPNGSGKSNLLRLLELISDTAAGRLAKSINDAGGMVPLLWDRGATSFGWRATLDTATETITLDMNIRQLGGGSAFAINRDTLETWRKYEQGRPEPPVCIYARGSRLAMVDDVESHGRDPFPDPDPNESLLSQVGGLSVISMVTKRELAAWRVHDDLEVGAHSAIRQPVVTQHSTLVEPDGSNLATVLHTLYGENRHFTEEIDNGMRAAFGEDFEKIAVRPVGAGLVQLAVHWRSSKTSHVGSQLSDGTLRFLLLLTILANPEPPPLIAIDEPEIGLHPSMLAILAEYAAEAAERTQVVISSHSPEFLDAFTEQEPHVTLCQWEDGRTQLLPLPPDQLRTWLEKYRLGEMFTCGDLDVLATPDVEPVEDLEAVFGDLPPEGHPHPPKSREHHP
ncbi:MAG: AAA family ATPase [Candidatus Nealsonbacteria bacterium]|nr:AAA family ATPase [Candidatus Nealsonbacteria bacterium]